jgi:hypothetical protein
MLRVIDSCAECMPLNPSVLRPGNVNLVAVHRISLSARADGNPDPIPDDRLTGPELVRRFENRKLGTGGKPPYTALLRTDASIEQMLPLLVQGQHAGSYNWCSWSVAVAGRYHERELPDRMWDTLVEALAVISVLPRIVKGHTELDKEKIPNCPGDHISMAWLRAAVEKRMPEGCETWDIRRRLKHIQRAGFAL